jgi:regulator of RNase E activity RraA
MNNSLHKTKPLLTRASRHVQALPSRATKTNWVGDQELFALARRELFVAVVGDAMDKLGLRQQFLPPQIRPLRSDMVIIGRAMPVLGVSVFDSAQPDSRNPLMSRDFGLMLEALDDLKRGEVYVCTGSQPNHACWGELMSLRAGKLGAAGAVCDGYSRDTNAILKLNFPTFSYGPHGQDSWPRYRTVDFRIGIRIGGVRIECGDIIYGDIDGVCVVPRAAVDEVFNAALEKARGEKRVRGAIIDGMPAQAAWDKFGIM